MCITGPIVQIVDLISEYWKTIPPNGIKPKSKEEIESYLEGVTNWIKDKSVNKLLVQGLMNRFEVKK